jgi:recombination protein RecA
MKNWFHQTIHLLAGRKAIRQTQPPFPGETPALSTGFSQLDRAIGLKGLPQGHLTELIGPDSLGTLSIAARIAAKFQRKQHPVLILDMNGQFNPEHAALCGLAAPELLRHVPPTAYALIEQVEQAASHPGLILIHLGLVARTFRHAQPAPLTALLNRLRYLAKQSPSVFLYVTTTLQNDPFIHLNYTPGFPLNEAADLRLWVQNEGWVQQKGQVTGYRGNITVIKNRLAPRGKGASLRIPFQEPDVLDMEHALGF